MAQARAVNLNVCVIVFARCRASRHEGLVAGTLLSCKAGANAGKRANCGAKNRAVIVAGTALRFPSLALSRSGTEGISHPELAFQDP
jgi:hypothetical protein